MNSQLSEQDRKAYEAYVLAETEEQRQEAIKRLIPGSHLHYHLHFIHKMKTPEGVREMLQNPDDQQMLEQFKKKYEKGSQSYYYKQIESRLLLKSYDVAETEEEKKKILDEITYKRLNLTFEDQKPDELLRAKAHLDSSSSQANDDDASDHSLSPPQSGDEQAISGSGDDEDEAPLKSRSISSQGSRSRSRSNSGADRRRKPRRPRRPRSNSNAEEEDDDEDDEDESPLSDQDDEMKDSQGSLEMQSNSQRPIFQSQARYYELDSEVLLQEPVYQQTQNVAYNNNDDFDDMQMQYQSNAVLNDLDYIVQEQVQQRVIPNTHQVSGPKTKKSELNYEKYFGQRVIRKIYTPNKKSDLNDSMKKLKRLPPGKEHKIDFTKYHAMAVGGWAFGIGLQNISDITNETFYQALKKFFAQMYKKDKHFKLPNSFCSNLSLIQLDKLATLHPSIKDDKVFIGQYFQKQFSEELSKENQEIWTNEEKRANILHLYNYAKSKSMPQSLQSSLLIEVLDLGIKLNIYDENLFREYLAIPQSEETSYFKNKRKAQSDNHWGQYIKNVQSENTRSGKWENEQKDFIKKYLEVFCSQKGSLEAFKDEFDSKFLKKIEERHQIFSSDDMTNLNIDLKKFQEVSQETIIRFLESNQEVFKVQEEPVLALELKNVQTLFIKIFEFNTETYYKKTLQPFNTSVNLDGLVASIEKKHSYTQAPNKKFQERFTFPELVNKVGLFIVEFIGNGVSARAIIKKGSLSLIHRPTIAGHLAYIIDENQKVCTGPKTGVIFDGQYYKSDEEKDGKIFIPYGKSSLSGKAIQIHNDFAQLCDFERSTEQYSFSAWIYVNRESLLIGNIASVIIHPQLLINKTQAQLGILRKTYVDLVLRNYIDTSIPITKKFENLSFDSSGFATIEFQVPAYLSSVQVSLSTEVFNVTLDQAQNFSISESFNITTSQSDLRMTEIYLRKQKQDYYLYLLGKNGEPKPKQTINVMAAHMFLGEDQMSNQIPLITDREGKVKLGHLKNIAAVIANTNENAERSFLINHDSQNFTYLSHIDLVENETCEFPVTFTKKARKHVSLIKRQTDCGVLEDCFEKIQFIDQINPSDGKDAKLFNLLRLENLPEGKYVLNIKNIQKKIKINVHRGQYWDGNNFVLKRNCLIENKAQQKSIKISSVKIEEAKDSTLKDVTINLEDYTPDSKVFLIAQQFENSFCSQEFWALAKKKLKSQSASVFPFAVWKNLFMSNRMLSDEYRYVFDRKYAERQLGNTLERPRLVLKRTFIQATTVDQQQLKVGTAYESIQLQSQMIQPMQKKMKKQKERNMDRKMDMMMVQNVMPRSHMRRDSYGNCDEEENDDCYSDDEDDEDYRGGRNAREQMSYDKMIQKTGSMDCQNVIPEFQNFLKHSSLVKTCLSPNQHGVVSVQLNLTPYTQLHVIAIDKSSVCKKQVDLTDLVATPKRDLCLGQTLDVNKGFTQSRMITLMNKGDTCFIDDITSTEIQIIDDLTKVQSIFESILKGSYQHTNNTLTQLLPLFQKWHANSLDEKNKLYNKFFSHELNIFIYHRDRKYFDDVVRPYIKNKMEKQFIDLYLLGQDQEVMSFNTVTEVGKLSPMEICFLIDTFARNGKVQEASKLLSLLDFQRKITDQTFKEITYNQTFDSILNMNMNSEGDSKAIDLTSQTQPHLFQQSYAIPSAAPNMYLHNQRRREMIECEMDDYNSGYLFGGDDDYGMECKKSNTRSRGGKTKSNLYDRDIYDEREKRIAGGRRQGFEELQKTGEYSETHFFDKVHNNIGSGLQSFNGFWYDYAAHLIQKNQNSNDETSSLMSDTESQIHTTQQRSFISGNFLMNGTHPHCALMTFAFLDLPLKAESHEFKTNEGRGLAITFRDHAILLKKEVKEAEFDLSNDILITHRYTKADLGYSYITQAAVTEEFLTNTAYQCEVIMTNVSPEQKDFSILYQIPQGSVPLQMTKYMKSQTMSLSSYTTQKVVFQFYFPAVGKFTHFPSSASKNEKIIAKAPINQLQAVEHLTIRKAETFMDILITGTNEDILEFLRTKDLQMGEKQYSESYIYWMMKEKSFFTQAIEILRSRYIYSSKIWSYGFLHNDRQAIIEYFKQSMYSDLISKLGSEFNSELLNISGEKDKEIKHLDYYPVVNSRAHNVGDVQQWSLNRNIRDTYEKLIQHLSLKNDLKLEDKMQLVYFLQLQDRVQEAIQMINKIDIEQENPSESLRIQYDYFRAYFDFFTGEAESYKTARAIVRKYEDYPVTSWRLLFLEILDQLNEIDGETDEPFDIEGDVLTDEQKRLKQKKSAKKEPRLEVEVDAEKKQVRIEVANFREISMKFYIIDAEILFSRTPFLKESTSEFSYVKPCYIIEKQMETPDLNASIDTISYLNQPQVYNIDIPEEFKHQNMVIEVNGEGKQVFKTYYPTQIRVNILAEYGELKVTDLEGKALSKVYVKVFYQKKGQTTDLAAFYKDGYTDIRGKFEYAQASGDLLKDVEKFALFVMSDSLGSIIKEIEPPKVEGGSEQVQQVMQQRKEQRIQSKVANYYAKSSQPKFK